MGEAGAKEIITVIVDPTAFTQVHDALEGSGEDYKSKLARLINTVEEIASGDIQGAPANDLLTKFREKEDQFRQISSKIDEADSYFGVQGQSLESTLNDLHSQMG